MNKRYDVKKINEIPIRVVADRLGMEITKKKNIYWTKCLWHHDESPSMVVGHPNNEEYNICHCYVCRENANVMKLVQTHENVDWLGACKWIETYMPEYPDIYKDDEPQSQQDYRRMRDKRNTMRLNREHRHAEKKDLTAVYDDTSMKPALSIEANKGDRYKSSFARCLEEVFGEERMKEVVDLYSLGAWKAHGRYDDVLFPSIDVNGLCRDMKVQAYCCDSRTERFFHRDSNVCYWLGSQLYPDAELDRNCLFGEHLLNVYPNKLVILVESPKNACVGAAAYPEYLWVAAGNKNMLNGNVLKVLQSRKVIVFPDEDAFDEWKEILSFFKDIADFLCMHPPGTGKKRDIADWIIEKKLSI